MELIGYLVPGFSESKSIKQMIYEYMENHSIARPEEISKDFPDLNKNTISFNVKIWKKFNLQKIKEYPSILINKYLNEMDLDQQIGRLAKNLLKDYLNSKNPSLNSDWKSFIAGTIYLASKPLEKDVSQNFIAEFINIDVHTISKIYRDICRELNISS